MPKKDPFIFCLQTETFWPNEKCQNRTTELYFETIEANQDPEKLTNFELECGLFSR